VLRARAVVIGRAREEAVVAATAPDAKPEEGTSSRGPLSEPKQRLLHAVIDCVREYGLEELSLRQLSTAIGSSHRMLLHHFGSKEWLLVEVVNAVEEDLSRAFCKVAMSAGAARADAKIDARLALAVMRGLYLDMLATGDRRGAGKAVVRFSALYASGAKATPFGEAAIETGEVPS
jgi:AcrR family transcriptional regulator